MGIKRIGGGMAVNQITEGVIWKQLLYFFFPILFGTFFQQLYNTADAVIVGQFVGTQALAAVGGATGSLINFFVNLFVGLASGTTVVIAQAYGAHDAESVGGTVHTSVALALAAGLGLTAVGVAAAPWALSAMGTPADIMDFALIYLRVYMLGTIPSFLYNVGSGILRAVGDPATRFEEDALRILRLYRFAARFGGELAARLEFRTINGVAARIIALYSRMYGRTPPDLLQSESETTPLLLQLFFFYYFFPLVLDMPGMSVFVTVLLTFVLNYAAYFAEIYRAGIAAVPKGQREAAAVLGYTNAQAFFRIVLPQVIKHILPPMANEFITLIKDTSLAFAIGVMEMFTLAKQISSAQRSMAPLIAAAVFYYVFNAIVAFIMGRAEKRLDYYR